VVVENCVLAKHEAGVVGWAKTRNQATAARLQASHVKQRQGMVHRVVWWCVQGDGGGGGCALVKCEAGGGGWAKNTQPSPMAQLRTGTGLQEVEGVLWGYKHPSHSNLWIEMGGEVLWCYGWVVVWLCLPGTPSASPLLPTHSTPHS
jgi:hypothetical protein